MPLYAIKNSFDDIEIFEVDVVKETKKSFRIEEIDKLLNMLIE